MTFSFAVFNIQFAQDIKSICITPLRQIVSIHHFASTRHFSVVRVSNPVELTNNRGPDVAEATKTVGIHLEAIKVRNRNYSIKEKVS